MNTYKILAHECITHTYYMKADSEEQARLLLMTDGNDPDKSETLEWEIIDVELEPPDDSGKDGICVACRGNNTKECTYC